MAADVSYRDSSLSVATQGATVRSLYVERDVKVYAIQESEVDSLSHFNTLATVSFSLATLFTSLPISLWANAAFSTELTPIGRIATFYLAPVGLILSGICCMSGIWALYKRSSTWSRIRSESHIRNEQDSIDHSVSLKDDSRRRSQRRRASVGVVPSDRQFNNAKDAVMLHRLVPKPFC